MNAALEWRDGFRISSSGYRKKAIYKDKYRFTHSSFVFWQVSYIHTTALSFAIINPFYKQTACDICPKYSHSKIQIVMTCIYLRSTEKSKIRNLDNSLKQGQILDWIQNPVFANVKFRTMLSLWEVWYSNITITGYEFRLRISIIADITRTGRISFRQHELLLQYVTAVTAVLCQWSYRSLAQRYCYIICSCTKLWLVCSECP